MIRPGWGGSGGSGGTSSGVLRGYDKTASTATTTLNYSDGNYCRLTLAANTTLAIGGDFPSSGGPYLVTIVGTQDGTGSWTVSVPTSAGWFTEDGEQPLVPPEPGGRFRLQIVVDPDAGEIGVLQGVIGELEVT